MSTFTVKVNCFAIAKSSIRVGGSDDDNDNCESHAAAAVVVVVAIVALALLFSQFIENKAISVSDCWWCIYLHTKHIYICTIIANTFETEKKLPKTKINLKQKMSNKIKATAKLLNHVKIRRKYWWEQIHTHTCIYVFAIKNSTYVYTKIAVKSSASITA